MKFAMLLFAIMVVLQPVGQILEKKGMGQIGSIGGFSHLFNPSTLWRIATNPYVIAGVILSAIGLFLWLGVLSSMNVSYIYPFGAISYIILAFLAYIILGEPISTTKWFGIATIVIGAFLLNQ